MRLRNWLHTGHLHQSIWRDANLVVVTVRHLRWALWRIAGVHSGVNRQERWTAAGEHQISRAKRHRGGGRSGRCSPYVRTNYHRGPRRSDPCSNRQSRGSCHLRLDLPRRVAETDLLLFDPDPSVHETSAREWCAWEDTHVSLAPGHQPRRWEGTRMGPRPDRQSRRRRLDLADQRVPVATDAVLGSDPDVVLVVSEAVVGRSLKVAPPRVKGR